MYSNQKTSENKPTTQIYSILDPELIPIIKDSILKNDIEKLKEVINKNNVNNLMLTKEEGNISPLMIAASEGNIEVVNFLLGCGAKVDLVSTEMTALACAASKGHAEVVKLLEENGASFQKEVVEYRSIYNKDTLLIKALSIFHYSSDTAEPSFKGVKYLLGRKEITPLINTKNEGGETPLFWAVLWGEEAIINLLEREHGASFKEQIIDYRSQQTNDTILIESFKNFYWKKYIKGIQYLLRRPGIESIISEKNIYGETALLFAIMKGEAAIFKTLENYGASFQESVINFRYPENNNTTLIEEIKNDSDNDADIQYLLKCPGIESIISEKSTHGKTALFWAAMKGREAIVKSLEDLGASFQKEVIEYRSSEVDDTALMRAIKWEIKGVKYLLSRPEITSIISVKNNFGETALLLAAMDGQEVIAKALEDLGASFQKEIIEYRGLGEEPDEGEEYQEESNTALIMAVKGHKRRGLKYLLQRPEIKATINEKDLKGKTALFYETFDMAKFENQLIEYVEEKVEMIKLFLESGADIEAIDIGLVENKVSQNKFFECLKAAKELMQLAQGNGTIKHTLSELLAAGASLHQRDVNGNTPLHLAVNSANESLIVELLKAGADIRAINDENLTPLQSAEQLCDINKIEAFLLIEDHCKASILVVFYLHWMESQLNEEKTIYEIKSQINNRIESIENLDIRAKIYLELGKKIKDEFYLSPPLTMEDGRDFLSKVSEKSPSYKEAQHQIAEMYFTRQIKHSSDFTEEETKAFCSEKSLFHSLRSGDFVGAQKFRTEVLGAFLDKNMGGNTLDPVDPTDLMEILKNYKNLKKENAELKQRLSVTEPKEGKEEVLLFDFPNNNNKRPFFDQDPKQSPDKKKQRISND